MREIKFRTWDKTWNRFYYFKMDKENFADTIPKNEAVGELTDWMQYTGLKDKNGTPIYEDDIVKGRYGIEKVKWHEHIAGFMPFAKGCNALEGGTGISSCEIIGNIYENPELVG